MFKGRIIYRTKQGVKVFYAQIRNYDNRWVYAKELQYFPTRRWVNKGYTDYSKAEALLERMKQP